MINNWRTSSYSGTDGDCVEVGGEHVHDSAPLVGVRDSKSRDTGQLGFTAPAWQSFLAFAAR